MSCISEIARAIKAKRGVDLALYIRANSVVVDESATVSLAEFLRQIEKRVPADWALFVNAWVKSALATDYEEKFRLTAEMAKQVVKFTRTENRWIEVVLYAACSQLKLVAVEADKPEYLVQCAYVLNSALPATTMCEKGQISDKVMGYYLVACLLLSIHFRLRAFSLADGIVKGSVTHTQRLPPIESLDTNLKAPWFYYTGVLAFVDQRYADASSRLAKALEMCPQNDDNKSSRQVLLMYLIPANIMAARVFPSKEFPWDAYPAIKEAYEPLIRAIRAGNTTAYREHLLKHRKFYTNKHLYLAVLRIQALCKVHLLNKVWIHRGRNHHLDLSDVTVAFEHSGVFDPEVERSSHNQLTQIGLAQMIADGDLKGVVYGDPHQKLVLKKIEPFPRIRQN